MGGWRQLKTFTIIKIIKYKKFFQNLITKFHSKSKELLKTLYQKKKMYKNIYNGVNPKNSL